MQYKIKLSNPLTHILNINLKIDVIDDNSIRLTLPIWRPGRYEAANYSKNLRKVEFKDENGHGVEYSKLDANTWLIDTKEASSLTVDYEYFAFTMDAGNSWYDEDLVYINFINCLLYNPERVNERCELNIELPDDYKIGCGLNFNSGHVTTKDYYELVDNPLLASKNLELLTYEVEGTPFNIWIDGEHNLDAQKLISDFKKFTKPQIASFGSFPEDEYHFMILALPYKHYHGVEHAKSTVICLGPGNELSSDKIYPELLGVSSHELFHAWNIIKIRPAEMMPYNFAKEVTFPTGFVAEGFTTYYGDLYLSRGQVFDTEGYFKELNTLFNRHFWNYGRLNESVVTSSLNLWIDGYLNATPHKKSSIYVEGAMVALCLDLLIRKETNSEKSLDDVMRLLWKNFGKKGVGYNIEDIKKSCEDVIGLSLTEFFEDYVYSTVDKHSLIIDLLEFVGCTLKSSPNQSVLASHFGLRGVYEDNKFRVMQIAPDSIGEQHFSVNDLILKVDDGDPKALESSNKPEVGFEIERNHKPRNIRVEPSQETYFDEVSIIKLDNATTDQKEAFLNWTGQSFL